MNTLWHNEINIWDWVYRALEIKKNDQSIKTGTTELKNDDSPENSARDLNIDEDKLKIEEESVPLEDSDYEILYETYKEADNEKNEKDEDNIIVKLIEKFKESIMPKRNKEIKDSNLIKSIWNTSKKPNHIKATGRKSQKPKAEIVKEDPLSAIHRNIDKKLK